ncbi:MAG: MogA/MoaB family molybdenum cofactor biosynthesis protein [Candidatus Zixiibacteriota bacterium]
MIKVAVITVSDKGYAGERKDVSGEVVKELVKKLPGEVVKYEIIPDKKEMIKAELIRCCDQLKIDLILTVGGTGFSPRDVTPEATLEVIERKAPGIPEAMRMESLKITPRAILSRAEAGIRGKSLIINLPGSPKGAKENLEVILPALAHGIEILQGKAGECAEEIK